MKINTNLKNFKNKHKKRINQIIYYKENLNNEFVIENLLDNFLAEKNSFVFESVEKGKIRGRYTIFGKKPDKIWELTKNKILVKNEKKITIIKKSPYKFLKKLLGEFKFDTPRDLPPICSLLAGFFSYDIIRYVEKIPDKTLDDLTLPDIRILRPTSLIIHDNLKKKIYYIVNCYYDQKIINYEIKFNQIKNELHRLKKYSIKKN